MMKLGVLLELIDRVTAPARRIAQVTKRLSTDMRLDRVVSAARGVGTAFGGVVRQAAEMTAKVVGGAALMGGALLAFVANSARAGDAVSRTAQIVAMSTGDWQRLAYAAELYSVAPETLGQGLSDLNKITVAAVRGNADAQAAFAQTGVALLDANGKVKSTAVIVRDLSAAFAAMPNDARKSELADKLFAGAGRELIPVLNAGAAGLAAMGDEAERYGRVMSEDAVDESRKFSETIKRLQGFLTGISNTIAAELLPVINPLLAQFRDWAVANREMIATNIAAFLKRLPEYIEIVIAVLRGVTKAAEPFIAALKWISSLLGPANTALLFMGAIIGGKLLFSIAKLVIAFGGLGKAILMTVASLARMALVTFASMLGHVFLAIQSGLGVMGAFNAVLAANPIGLVIIAVAALAASAYLIYKNWGSVVAFFSGLFDALKTMGTGVTEFFAGVFTGNFQRAFDGIKTFLSGWIDWFTTLFSPVMAAIDKIGSIGSGAAKMLGFGDGRKPGEPPAGGGAGSVPVSGRNEVGGELRISIDSEGQPRVRDLKADNPKVPITVDTGRVMQ